MNLRDEGLYGLTVVLAAPIAVSVLITVGAGGSTCSRSRCYCAQAGYSQALEAEGRPAWDHAVERFVIWCGVAPVFVAGLPATIAGAGRSSRRGGNAVLGCLSVLLFFEKVLSGIPQAAVHLFLPAGKAAGLGADCPVRREFERARAGSAVVPVGVGGDYRVHRALQRSGGPLVAMARHPAAPVDGIADSVG